MLGSPNPVALAQFYSELLGWEISNSEPDWVTMAMRDGQGAITHSNLAFQLEEDHERPVWPGQAGAQQMQVHLDIGVRDVAAATEDAIALGAQLAEFQPQSDVRVMLDPDGHPFCLYLNV